MTAPAFGAPAADPAAALVVGVADLRLTADPGARLVTYALGSCLGVAIYDPVAGVAGLLHVMLPSSSLAPARAAAAPATFVDTGVPLLFRESYRLGARKERLVVRVAGGARAAEQGDDDQFQIGRRNLRALHRLLRRNRVPVQAADVGGYRLSRTVLLDAATGEFRVRTSAPGLAPRDATL